jgi:hypothetical protein
MVFSKAYFLSLRRERRLKIVYTQILYTGTGYILHTCSPHALDTMQQQFDKNTIMSYSSSDAVCVFS